MNLRLKAYDLILKTLVCLGMTLILNPAKAVESPMDEPIEDYRTSSDLVELYTQVDYDEPYKKRRATQGFMLGLAFENILLDRYLSVIDGTTFYQDMFGETEFPLYSLNLSYKYNFSLGSLAANFGFGQGFIESEASGVERTLTLTRYTASATYIMDAIFDEPYAAPYGTFGVMRLTVDEKNSTESVQGNIDMLYYMQAGILFQLDWLDTTVSYRSLVESGLENTYLDLFMAKYEPSANTDDPDTSTDYIFGAGLRLEY